MIKKSSPSSQFLQLFRALMTGDVQNSKVMMLRYLCVAVVATLCDYALNVLCYTLIDTAGPSVLQAYNIAISVTVGFLFGVWINYVLSVRWAFQGSNNGQSTRDQWVFFITAVMGLGINIAVVAALEKFAQIDPRLGRIPAIFIAFLWNFYSKKWWVFKS